MARFLFSVWPFPGHINPSMAVAHALAARGHEIGFYTGARASTTVLGEGFRHFGFEQVNEERLYQTVMSPKHSTNAWKHPFRLINALREWLVSTLPAQVRDLEKLLDRWKPDIIVCDVTMWGPPLILRETRRVPVAILAYAVGCMIPGPGVPPWGLGLPKPTSWGTRLLNRVVEALTERRVESFRRDVNRVRSRYGLERLDVPVHNFLGTLPLYIVPSAPELDYDRSDLPESVHYVGPLVWNRTNAASLPSWLVERTGDRPLVHVTEGTMHAWKPFLLRAAARGLADLPLDVIMTSGDYRNPGELGLNPLPPNVRLERWVPHSELLQRTDVLVTTGGAGTVLTALKAGVPMVVVPTEWDKPDNAQRVVEAKCGIRLSPRRCTPKRLRHAVERILDDPSFLRNAQRLAAALVARGGAQRACEQLEAMCGQIPNGRTWKNSNRV